MILTKLRLEHFKCFKKLSLHLAPLTLLTGFNSAGKSTVMQALALLYQTAKDNEWSNHLLLNGSAVALGTTSDVIDEIYGRNEIAIGIETEDYQCKWRFLSEQRVTYTIPVQEIILNDYLSSQEKSYLIDSQMALHRLLPKVSYAEFPQMTIQWSDLISQLTYLTAERIGPREIYSINSPTKHLLTACLGADKGQIILIENPEAHLHPAAQTQMGLFLAKVANAGVQIILETHSDHVLSGVRRAVKEKQLIPEQVAIYFFRSRPEEESNAKIAQALAVLIDDEGNLDGWPKGFFDQFEIDTAYFAGWGEHGFFGE